MEEVEKFIKNGEYFEALKLIEIMRKWTNIEKYDILKLNLFQTTILQDLGRYKEGLKIIEETILESQKKRFTEIEFQAMLILSKLEIYTGRFKESLNTLLEIELKFESLLKDESIPYKTLRTRFLRLKGISNRATGENELARISFEESLKLAEELENEQEISKTLDRIAMNIHTQDTEEALKLLKRSLEIRKRLGNKYHIGQSLNRLGIVYLRKGMLDEALAYYNRSLEIAKLYDNKDFQAIVFMNLGTVYDGQGKLNKSLENYIKGLNLSREVDNKNMISASLYNISGIYRQRGELDKALEYQEECLEEFKILNYHNGIAASLYNIGLIYYNKGELDKSHNFLKRSLSLREEAKNHVGSANSSFHLIQLSLDRGLLEDAKYYLNKLEVISESIENVIIHQLHSIAEALLLKNSTRIPKRARAEETDEKSVKGGLCNYRGSA